MRQENSTLLKKLKQYSAMAAPLLTVSAMANAQIIYSDVDPDFDLVDSTQNDGFLTYSSLDLDNDGVMDFNFFAMSYQINQNGTQYINLAGVLPYTTTGGANANGNAILGYQSGTAFYYPSALDFNDPIDSNGDFWSQVARIGTMVWSYVSGLKYGAWDNVTDKYMGVRFLGGDGLVHFGWIRIDVVTSPVKITIKDYAYDSGSQVAIDAGDVGNIGMPTINEAKDITIFAFEKTVFISSVNPNSGEMNIKVTDMTGKNVMDLNTNENNTKLNLADLANGLYIVTVQKGTTVKTRKVSLR